MAVAAFVAVPSAGLGGDHEGEQWELKEIRQQESRHEGSDAPSEFTTPQLRQDDCQQPSRSAMTESIPIKRQ